MLGRLGLMLGLFVLTLAWSPGTAAAQATERRTLPPLPELPVAEGKRVALVIGNSDYLEDPSWRDLPNAARDAHYVAEQLRNPVTGSGAFEVLTLLDANHAQMKAGIERFAAMAAGADIALVYYAGHGFEFNLENYLVPVDAPQAVSPISVERAHIKMADVIKAATARQFSLFFLDACRTTDALRNTGENRAGNRATLFGAIDARGSGVIYSASRGESAYDAAPAGETNSPFAKAVVRYLNYPGLSLYDFFSYVSLTVEKDTAGLRPPQSPAIGGRGGHQFFMVPKAAAAPVVPVPVPVPMPVPTPQPALGLAEIVSELMGEDDDKFLLIEALDAYGIPRLQSLSDQNDPLASVVLGHVYYHGLTVEMDRAKAKALFERAAATGHPEGLYALARYLEIMALDYQVDISGEQDVGDLYRRAYAMRNFKAGLRLADLYANRILQPPADDPNEHIDIWKDFAALGDANAHLELLIRDVEPTVHLAALKSLAAEDDTDAASNLCFLRDALELLERLDYCIAAADEDDELAILIIAEELLPSEQHDLDSSEVSYWARIGLNSPYVSATMVPCLEAMAQTGQVTDACQYVGEILVPGRDLR